MDFLPPGPPPPLPFLLSKRQGRWGPRPRWARRDRRYSDRGQGIGTWYYEEAALRAASIKKMLNFNNSLFNPYKTYLSVLSNLAAIFVNTSSNLDIKTLLSRLYF